MTKQIDLAPLTAGGAVAVISGRERGEGARRDFDLPGLDTLEETINVLVPEHVRAITPSFVLGMFGASVVQCGTIEKFFDKFHFDAKPHIVSQIRRGAQYSLLKGTALDSA